MINRRELVRTGTLATLGAAGIVASRPSSAAAAQVGPQDWDRLAAALSSASTLYRPGDPGYAALALPFNHRYSVVAPAGIVACGSSADVSSAIRWAGPLGLPAVPRSGLGHNYAGYSTTTGLLLNMSRMKDISSAATPRPARSRTYGPVKVAHEAGTVTVGAGVTNGDLHPMLEDRGMFVPTGRCPSVGVAGLVLGGGIGFSDKMFGLTCDRLVATTVVLADGREVTASAVSEPDLFWACRGGAGNNFGVHTSFTFHYERFAGDVGFYDLKWGLDSVEPVMAAAQRIAKDTAANQRFHLRLGLGTKGLTPEQIKRNANVNAIGQHFGTLDELLGILKPLLSIGTASEQAANRASVREVTPAMASELLGATTPVDQFAAKSAILTSSQILTGAQVRSAAAHLLTWPGSRNSDGAGFAMFGLGGAINQVSPTATAFRHRDGLFIFCAETSWADQDPPELAASNQRWLSDFFNAVFAGAPPQHAYQNFPDPELRNWQQEYYGENYDRLVRVKRHYDPHGFFGYPQGIGR